MFVVEIISNVSAVILFSRLCHKHHSTGVKGRWGGGGGRAPVGAVIWPAIYHYPVVSRIRPLETRRLIFQVLIMALIDYLTLTGGMSV